MSHFDNFWQECANAPAATRSYLAIWVHHDGRCMGMTGISQHRLPSIPAGFVKDTFPLDQNVDIYVEPIHKYNPLNYRK